MPANCREIGNVSNSWWKINCTLTFHLITLPTVKKKPSKDKFFLLCFFALVNKEQVF